MLWIAIAVVAGLIVGFVVGVVVINVAVINGISSRMGW